MIILKCNKCGKYESDQKGDYNGKDYYCGECSGKEQLRRLEKEWKAPIKAAHKFYEGKIGTTKFL